MKKIALLFRSKMDLINRIVDLEDKVESLKREVYLKQSEVYGKEIKIKRLKDRLNIY